MALTGLSPKSPAQNAARIFVKAGSHSVTKCAFLDLEPFVPYNDKYGDAARDKRQGEGRSIRVL
jgi:hypothetical protein